MTTRQALDLLRAYESRNVTFIEADGSWPIVWERAKGIHVWAADGKKYLDLTAAFGVASAGHANPRVVRAGQEQMQRLLHAMGDVHPHSLKARLARELSRITYERWTRKPNARPSERLRGKSSFCNSGFEAVEVALKTAMLATGRPGVIAFEGGYHGLGYGTLNATHREHFKSPFRSQLAEFGHFVPFPSDELQAGGKDGGVSLEKVADGIRNLFRREKIGAVLVEPIQGRGGINVPPAGFLPMLREVCRERGALLILDEVYTGFGRTGKWFACEDANVVPDLICLGKALTGGFPLSACVGRADVMDAAWPPSNGEAIHTSTFLGHPVGCAMALAQIEEIRRLKLVERSATLGKCLIADLSAVSKRCCSLQLSGRGKGLLAGLELREPGGSPASAKALQVVKKMLGRGFILLPEGAHSNVISFSPPLTIPEVQLRRAVGELEKAIAEIERGKV